MKVISTICRTIKSIGVADALMTKSTLRHMSQCSPEEWAKHPSREIEERIEVAYWQTWSMAKKLIQKHRRYVPELVKFDWNVNSIPTKVIVFCLLYTTLFLLFELSYWMREKNNILWMSQFIIGLITSWCSGCMGASDIQTLREQCTLFIVLNETSLILM